MIRIRPTEGMLHYCQSLVADTDFGKGVPGSGNQEQQYVGMVCENAVKYVLGFPVVTNSSPDPGWDFMLNGKRVDIKGQGRTVDPRQSFVCNFVARQKPRQTDFYLFASFNKKTGIVTICGLIEKGKFFKQASFFAEGDVRRRSDGSAFSVKSPMYEIGMKYLEPVNCLDDLRAKII